MHFEVLVEDTSGSIAVGILLEKILGPNNADHSWRMRSYRGLGRLPQHLGAGVDASRRILLDRLPQLLRGYGRSLDPAQSCVVVVVDADRRDCVAFKQELLGVLLQCEPRPRTLFRIAVEESEAWLLGDRDAVLAAYPNARAAVLDAYVQDSVDAVSRARRGGGATDRRRQRSPRRRAAAQRRPLPQVHTPANTQRMKNRKMMSIPRH